MKAKLFIIVLVVVLLTACGGNATTPEATQEIVSTPEATQEIIAHIFGCVAVAYLDPSGNPEIFSNGETSPDGRWICVGEGPDGPFSWFKADEIVQEVEQVELAPTATPVKVVVVGPAPVLHHDESNPPESGMGSFDIGVQTDQIGIVFGVHIAWLKGDLDAGGKGCNLVVLTPGWYENLQILDGRYEVYDIPMNDYPGWVEVLSQQRADEQSRNYGCPVKEYQDIPQWESDIVSPP